MAKSIAFGILFGLLAIHAAAGTTGVTPVIMWSDNNEFTSSKHEVSENVGLSTITGIVKALGNHTQSPYLADSGKKPDVFVVFGFEDLETPEFIQLSEQYGESAKEETYFFNTLREVTEKQAQTSLIFPYVKSYSLTRLVSQLRSFGKNNFYEVNLRADGKERIIKLIERGSMTESNETQIIYIGLGSIVKMLEGSFVDQEGFFELVDLVKSKFQTPVFMISGSSCTPKKDNSRTESLAKMDRRLLEEDESDDEPQQSSLNGTTVTGLAVFIFFLGVVGIITGMLLNTQTPITYTKVPLLKGKES